MSDALPHWRLETIYAGVDDPAFADDRRRLEEALDDLEAHLDAASVRQGGAAGVAVAEVADALEGALSRLEPLLLRFARLRVFLSTTVSVDAFAEAARAALSSLDPAGARLDTASARLAAYLADVDLDAVVARSELLRDHAYLLRRSQAAAAHLMGEEAEALAAALDGSGGTAWGRLQGELVGRSTVEACIPEGAAPGDYGLAELRVLQAEADEGVRRAAYEAELRLLRRHDVSFAAAMNGIKGQVGELSRRRGWATPLDATLFDNAIDRASLEAMRTACREHFPTLRRYLLAKARRLGKPALAWYDLFAPIDEGASRTFSWDEAKAFVLERFAAFSPRLADFAARAFDGGWVDVPPRKGKRNGAFCAPVHALQESRIMLNFGGRLDDVFTLAHELGHGYHNDCMYRFGRGVLRSGTPMTLAETASIFCETLVLGEMLRQADEQEQVAILEQDLQSTAQLVLDVHTRFEFERETFERRGERALSAAELDDIMERAQREAYGEALAPDATHPMMWAQKPHYYSSGRSFYNYPYTFGYLFGLGLYNRYRTEPDGFAERYDELLASTGMADAAELAARFDIDLHDPAFWRGGLSVTADRVDIFEKLTQGVRT